MNKELKMIIIGLVFFFIIVGIVSLIKKDAVPTVDLSETSAQSDKFDPQEFADKIYPQKPTKAELEEQYKEQNLDPRTQNCGPGGTPC